MTDQLDILLDFENRCEFVRISIEPSERVWVCVLLAMIADRVLKTESPDKSLKDVIKTLKSMVDSRLKEKTNNILGE